MVSENTSLKGKLCTAQETVANSGLESKASRETINRLVSELNNEQALVSSLKREVENVKKVTNKI